MKLFALVLATLWCIIGRAQCPQDSIETARKLAAIRTAKFIVLIDPGGNVVVMPIDSIKSGQAFLLRSWDFVKTKPKCVVQ